MALDQKTVDRIRRLQKQGMGVRAIAREVGVNPSTVSRRLRGRTTAKARSTVDTQELSFTQPCTEAELMAAFDLDPTRWVPTRFNIGVSRYGTRGSLSLKRIMPEAVEDAILQFVRENVRPICPPRRPARAKGGKYLAVLGFYDLHIGMYAWQEETGADWDVDIACRRAANAIDDLCDELSLYDIDQIILPWGGDILHYDSVRQQTASAKHELDCDTRFGRVYLAALRIMSYIVERAARLCANVETLYIAGNHDPSTGFTLCAALAERYRNDPRITIDLSANPRKYRLYGGTLLGFAHGTVPESRMKLIFAEEAKEHWSVSTCRELHQGHTHQRWAKDVAAVTPLNGLTIRTNPSLTAADYWHHQHGFVSAETRCMEAWRYDRQGCRGSHVAGARDDTHTTATAILDATP